MVDSSISFLEETLRIVEEAKKQGITLRILGALAIRHHCPKFASLHDALGRVFSDIDFVGYSKQSSKIRDFFEKLGYTTKPMLYSFAMEGRLIFLDDERDLHIDVFLDRLAMCHTIELKTRLEVDYPTIPLADLLLEKMQIVQLSEKDVKDTIVLIREHEVGNDDKDKININYIAKILSKDWGFYYTVTMNLKKIKGLIENYTALSDQDKEDVNRKIDKMLDAIEREPKSLKWKMRAKIGNKKKWYRDVYTPKK